MAAHKKHPTIDRLELERLLDEQKRSKKRSRRDLFGSGAGISRNTYAAIRKSGTGKEEKLEAIARAAGLKGTSAFLAVGINSTKLVERRRQRKWTEKDLAGRCQSGQGQVSDPITAETIKSLEKGKVPPPDGSHELCRRLAAALECSFEDLAYDPSVAGPSQVVGELLGPLSERWARRVFAAQHPKTGGLFAGLATSGFTQPWSTAQALVGALQVPGVAIRHGDKIRRMFEYLSRWRYPIGRPVNELSPQDEQGWALAEAEAVPVPVTEITSWVLIAYSHALQTEALSGQKYTASLASEIEALLCRQCVVPSKHHPVGGFCPTHYVCELNQRTYSTVIALWALLEVSPLIRHQLQRDQKWDVVLAAIGKAVQWLLVTRDKECGWVPKPLGGKRSRYPGLTAQALFVLTLLRQSDLEVTMPVGYTSALTAFLLEIKESSRAWGFRDSAGDVSINTGDVWVLGNPPYRLEGTLFYWAPWTLALVGLLIRSDYPGTMRKQQSMHDHLTVLRDRMAILVHEELTNPARRFFGAPELGEALFAVSWLSPGSASDAIRGATNRTALRQVSSTPGARPRARGIFQEEARQCTYYVP